MSGTTCRGGQQSGWMKWMYEYYWKVYVCNVEEYVGRRYAVVGGRYASLSEQCRTISGMGHFVGGDWMLGRRLCLERCKIGFESRIVCFARHEAATL